MIDIYTLRLHMERSGYDRKVLAKALGLSEKTLQNKINSGKLGLDEANNLITLLRINCPADIFFLDE